MRADSHAVVAHDLCGDERDAAHVPVAVGTIEAETRRQVRPHDVAVEHRGLTARFEQEHGQDLRDG